VKKVAYLVFGKFCELAKVVALCGGSDNVRYGREGPEKLFAAELNVQPGELIWLFVQVYGGHLVAVQIQWDEMAWASMAIYGIQPADCPPEIWNGAPAILRKRNIPDEWLTFEQALSQHLATHPATTRTVDFMVSQ
jgi:hypothetical protein